MGNNLSCKQREMLLAQQLKNQARYCKVILENNRKQSTFRHDIKTHCLCLEGFLEKGDTAGALEYIKSMYESISANSAIIDTNNVVFDALFFEKIESAEEKNIYVDWNVAIGRELKISEVAWCVLVGCTMDYAIEACEQVTDREKRIIVRIKCVGNTLSLYMKNSEDQMDVEEHKAADDNRAETPGLASRLAMIEKLVAQYDGVLERAHKGGFFEMKFLLCGI